MCFCVSTNKKHSEKRCVYGLVYSFMNCATWTFNSIAEDSFTGLHRVKSNLKYKRRVECLLTNIFTTLNGCHDSLNTIFNST